MNLAEVSRRQWLLLAGILVLAAAMRLYGLDIQSLWLDELWALRRGSYASVGKVLEELGRYGDHHPPGYNLALHFVQTYVGNSAFVIRLPSAIAGILAVFAMFLLGLRLYTAREGLIAAAFTAVLLAPIEDSQDARPYALLFLFSIVSSLSWIELTAGLRERGASVRHIVPYVASATVLAYVHYFGLLLVGLQGLAALVMLRTRCVQPAFFAAYSLVGAAYVPWLHRLIADLGVPSGFGMPPIQLADVFRYIRHLLNWSSINALIAVTLFAPWAFRRADGTGQAKIAGTPATTLLMVWFGAPLLVVWIAPFLGLGPRLWHFRALVIAMPAAYLLLARAVTRLPGGGRIHAFASVLLIGCFLSQLVFGIGYYSRTRKQQFREAVRFVAERIDDPGNERSVIFGCAHSVQDLDYYFKRLHPDRRVDFLACDPEDVDRATAFLERAQPKLVWYVAAAKRPSSELLDALVERRILATHQSFYGADVWVFRDRRQP